MTIDLPKLIAGNALFAINHSGGKDSQAMMIKLLGLGIPARQLVVVHADMGEVEWKGTLELARTQAENAGVAFIVARAVKTFIEMVEHRFAVRPDAPSFPSASIRNCTSDLKRGPIDRELRRYAAANGFATVVSCVGIRAAESTARSKLVAFQVNKRNTISTRAWFDWLPIFDLTTQEVFDTVAQAGQELHWAYKAGNERLSCVFCVMGSVNDILNGAAHNPDLFAKMSALEARTGYTLHMSRKTLVQIVAEAEALAA